MDINTVIDIISKIGFPMAVCLICFWYINKIQTQTTETIAKMNEQHKIEMDKMSEAINNNTAVMQRLIDKIDK